MAEDLSLTYALRACGFSNKGRRGCDKRLLVEAVFFRARFGGLWRHLPERYGKWKSIHSRFTDWAKRGVWFTLFQAMRSNKLVTTKLRFVDATFIKCSVVALTGQHGGGERVAARTKGGHSTKFTALVDSRMRVHSGRIDPGNLNDHTIAYGVGLPGSDLIVVGDKGYSSAAYRRYLESRGHGHCIAKQRTTKADFAFNKRYYKMRHKVENAFGRLKLWAGLEIRRERNPVHFASLLSLWMTASWIDG